MSTINQNQKIQQTPASLNDIEYLRRKFFVGPGNDSIFKKWGEIAMELALDWQKNPGKRKIHADISLPELAEMFKDVEIPNNGLKIEEVFQECQEKILNNSVRINNPRYIGHMATGIPWFSVVVDILTTSINQNQVKIETALASSFVERQTLGWMHRMVYQQDKEFYDAHMQNVSTALGNVTSGGTLGNLTALAVAREKALPGVGKKGMVKALMESGYSDIAILASQRVHYSMKKAAMVLGMGENSVITIPVDHENRIQVDKIQSTIAELKRNNVLIIALVGIAGTTETGNIDPLEDLASIAQSENIWFHVDAAWGGAVLLSDELRPMLKGIEQADSTVLDGHKLFYLPMAHGAVVFKNPHSLDLIRHTANYIIRKGSVDIGQTTLEGSRRFNSLKFWFSMKMLGTRGYNILLKKSIRMTNVMAEMVDNHPDFQRTSTPEICILTYRFIPKSWRERLKEAVDEGRTELVREMNEKLNTVNVELQKRQRECGVSFVSRTTLESTGYDQEIVVFRAVLINLLTKSEFLAEILEEQKGIGEEIFQEFQF